MRRLSNWCKLESLAVDELTRFEAGTAYILPRAAPPTHFIHTARICSPACCMAGFPAESSLASIRNLGRELCHGPRGMQPPIGQ